MECYQLWYKILGSRHSERIIYAYALQYYSIIFDDQLVIILNF